MKFNWGWGIAILFSLFVVGMTSLVFRSFQQNCDLVHEDYYSEELKYQQQIDKQIKTNQLKTGITYDIDSKELIIKFPAELTRKNISGEVLFFRPSDKNKDLKVGIHLIQGEQHFPLKLFNKGFYKIKINWKADEIEYFDEKSMTI